MKAKAPVIRLVEKEEWSLCGPVLGLLLPRPYNNIKLVVPLRSRVGVVAPPALQHDKVSGPSAVPCWDCCLSALTHDEVSCPSVVLCLGFSSPALRHDNKVSGPSVVYCWVFRVDSDRQ